MIFLSSFKGMKHTSIQLVLIVLGLIACGVFAEPPVDWKDHGRDWTDGKCANHDAASPINFADFQTPLLLQKSFSYNYDPIESAIELVNDGYSVHTDVKPLFSQPDRDMGGIKFDNGYHHLDRIDFHSQSEHMFKGKHLPLEIQLTHRKKNSNSKIIVSILVTAPDEDQLKPKELLQKGAFLRRSNHAKRKASHKKGQHRHRKMRGHDAPDKGLVFDSPDDPNEDEMEKDLHITEADEDGMAEVVLGPRKSNNDILKEDFEEIHEYQDWDLGVNYTIDHPDMQMPPSDRSKPKIIPASAGPYGLAVAGKSQKRTNVAQEPATYNPPADSDPEFSPLLQGFLNTAGLPMFEEKVKQNHSLADPLNLNALFDNFTFFEYGGTQTLPPCEEATWLVRREVMMASTPQAKQFFKTLHTMSEDAGNYRTLMPVNSRVIEVRKSSYNSNIPPWRAVEEAKDNAERTISSKVYGQDAVKIAETASNYIRDMETRLKRAAIAHAMELYPKALPSPPPVPPPPGLPYSEQWLDPKILKYAMGSSAGSHAKAVSEAVGEHAKQTTQEAAQMAANGTLNYWQDAYQAAMAAAPGGAPVPAPAPPPGAPSDAMMNT